MFFIKFFYRLFPKIFTHKYIGGDKFINSSELILYMKWNYQNDKNGNSLGLLNDDSEHTYQLK